MKKKKAPDAGALMRRATPNARQQGHEIQPFGHNVKMPIALSQSAVDKSVDNLNQLLADTMTLRDLYKKHHWQVTGPTFYQLHLLFDKHYDEQVELVDSLAERIQLLGGVTIAMAADVAATSIIADKNGGDGTNDLIVSDVIRTNELQVWFVSQHVVDEPVVRADQ